MMKVRVITVMDSKEQEVPDGWYVHSAVPITGVTPGRDRAQAAVALVLVSDVFAEAPDVPNELGTPMSLTALRSEVAALDGALRQIAAAIVAFDSGQMTDSEVVSAVAVALRLIKDRP